MRATRFLVSGIVQGVGFRYFARRSARALGVRGSVRNLRDGRVEALAAGPPEALAEFERTLRAGPAGARVTGVQVTEADIDDDTDGFAVEA